MLEYNQLSLPLVSGTSVQTIIQSLYAFLYLEMSFLMIFFKELILTKNKGLSKEEERALLEKKEMQEGKRKIVKINHGSNVFTRLIG